MKYNYFISYFSSDYNTGISAYGSCQVIRDKKINCYEDILSIMQLIEEKYNRQNVILLNYKLLNEDLIMEEDND